MADQIQIINQPLPKDVDKNNACLFCFNSVFPFDLFPDTITVDKLKISIIERDFLINKRIVTLPLTGTLNVRVDTGPLLAQIQIFDGSVDTSPVVIKNISNSDALQFQQLVEGIVIGMRQGVNLREMKTSEVRDNAIKWGSFNMSS